MGVMAAERGGPSLRAQSPQKVSALGLEPIGNARDVADRTARKDPAPNRRLSPGSFEAAAGKAMQRSTHGQRRPRTARI